MYLAKVELKTRNFWFSFWWRFTRQKSDLPNVENRVREWIRVLHVTFCQLSQKLINFTEHFAWNPDIFKSQPLDIIIMIPECLGKFLIVVLIVLVFHFLSLVAGPTEMVPYGQRYRIFFYRPKFVFAHFLEKI